ncbi:alpha-E domain-containing protein, partial [Brucella sp. 21LCYQ03]|nr:alpha-E domain-containing protein [Brucella sp. 21LCYQ03]
MAFQDGLSNIQSEEIVQKYNIKISKDYTIDEVLSKLLLDIELPSSVFNNIFKARENARSAQDNINRELWQSLNDLYHQIRNPQLLQEISYDPYSVIDELIKRCMHYYGIINNSVSRSEGFYFLNLGKFVERGLQCIQLMKEELILLDNGEQENLRWRYFLMSFNGYELYLCKHFGRLDTEKILEQMLYADNYPNSLIYCWHEIAHHAEHLYGEGSNETAVNLSFVIGKSYSNIKYSKLNGSTDGKCAFLNA